MAGFGDMVQKAVYLGLGLASYAGERAGSTFSDLRSQAQKLADEMVSRGEMTADEAKRMVDDMVNRAKQSSEATSNSRSTDRPTQPIEPRTIEIQDEDGVEDPQAVESLRDQVSKLRDELNRLKQN